MRILRFTLALVAAAVLLEAQSNTGWHLVWSDEFNGPANSPPDATKWNYDLGGGGWGNGEQETYTNSSSNAFQDGKGHLVIRAIKDASGNFTSARLRTGRTSPSDAVNLNWQYGKVEARIKLPFGQGVWPAFWMLGSNITSVSWPTCGEIDILENFGSKIDDASTIHGTIHGPPAGSDYAGTGISAKYTLPLGAKLTDDYHLFSIAWSQDSIQFFVDGTSYQKITAASVPAGDAWVFNQPFFIILNLAIGGPSTFLGPPAANTVFPQDMLIDYVRVYQTKALAANTPGISPGGIVNAASGLGTITPGALASLYGVNLADNTYTSSTPTDSGLFQNGVFGTSTKSGVSVSVNGVKAPLTYVSPRQINFQIPWETPVAPTQVNVAVDWNGATSETEAVTVTPAAPSVFLDNSGIALATQCSHGIATGSECILWGNGFGQKNVAEVDGAPSNPSSLAAIETVNQCTLAIDGQPAEIAFCGAAPYLIIDQLNFVYPGGVTAGAQTVSATLTINGVTGTFAVPAPGQ